MKSFLAKAVTVGLGIMVLAGCYTPMRFDAEVEIDRAGYYSLKFDGYLAETNLYTKMQKGEISSGSEEEQRRVTIIERDFTRDSNTKEFQYFRDGVFRVLWERSGDMVEAKTMTFIRRNELILQLKYVDNSGYIVLEGRSLTKDNRQRLAEAGLNMTGEIRVKTDMPVKSHNATYEKKDPRDKRFTWLVWEVENVFSPRPRAIFIFD
ncbi:hypothetical protein ACFL12_03920 [Pseudomonadota bacterium]